MFDMKEMCRRRGLRLPNQITYCRGRIVYRVKVNSDELYAVANELHYGGCRPSVGICSYANCTVELVENRTSEKWCFRFYATSDSHAETTCDEILSIILPHRQFQEVLDL